MANKIFYFPTTIKESYLDNFDHVNNAQYLVLYEEARWAVINQNGYNVEKVKETGLGPIILEIKLRFKKELRAHDQIIIETQMLPYKSKIGSILQRMLRVKHAIKNLDEIKPLIENKEYELCSQIELTTGLFDTQKRKLVLPTKEWLKALALN